MIIEVQLCANSYDVPCSIRISIHKRDFYDKRLVLFAHFFIETQAVIGKWQVIHKA